MSKINKRALWITLVIMLIALLCAFVSLQPHINTNYYADNGSLSSVSNRDFDAMTSQNGGIKQIAAGMNHTMILFNNGEVFATGKNEEGQLGLGDNTNRNGYTLVTSLAGKKVSYIACGRDKSFAVADGKLYATGDGKFGEIGKNYFQENVFTEIVALSDKQVTAVAVGLEHTLYVADGKLYGAGMNYEGQLGLGGMDRTDDFTEITYFSGKNITDIECGLATSMVVADGVVYATGGNFYGELGFGDRNTLSTFSPIPSLSGKTPISISLDNKTTGAVSVVVTKEGVYVAGDNLSGELGLGEDAIYNTYESFTEVTTFKGKNVTAAEIGYCSIIIAADGQVYKSGLGYSGVFISESNIDIEMLASTQSGYIAKSCDTAYIQGNNLYGELPFGEVGDSTGEFLEIEFSYTIRYDDNGGVGKIMYQTLQYGRTSTLLAHSYINRGYNFLGWALTPDGPPVFKDRQAVAYAAEPGKTTDLYAVWDDGIVYKTAAGANHSLILLSDGMLLGSGSNNVGQLGLDDTVNNNSYVKLSAGHLKVIDIACGDNFSMLLTSSGEVYVSGTNAYGALGLGDTSSVSEFTRVPSLDGKRVTAIACGPNHSMVIADGKVYASGSNMNGQLGLGDMLDRHEFTEVTSLSGKYITNVSCAAYNSMALSSAGKAYITGNNDYGQLGIGSSGKESEINSFAEIKGFDDKTITDIAAGHTHSFVIADGQLFASGSNDSGRIGLGTISSVDSFTAIPSLSGKTVTSVSTSQLYSMIVADGKVYSTGFNRDGQLGLGDNINRNIFSEVTSIKGNNIKLSCSTNSHSMLVVNSKAYVTGNNTYGQLGINKNEFVNAFTEVTLTYKVVYSSNGGSGSMPEQMFDFGYMNTLASNAFGQNGRTFLGWSIFPDSTMPEYYDCTTILSPVNPGETLTLYAIWKADKNGIIQVSTGSSHTLVLYGDGSVYATGKNEQGQLGLGDNTNRNTFTKVTALEGHKITYISAGYDSSMAISDQGVLFVAGNNNYGQLGLGDKNNRNTFTRNTTLTGYTVVNASIGEGHSLIVITSYSNSNSVWAVGRNNKGQLGLYDNADRLKFTQTDQTNVSFIECGDYFSLLTRSGSLYGTGENYFGQLGLGDYNDRNSFCKAEIPDNAHVTNIAASPHHVMIVASGNAYGTGYAIGGQLGYDHDPLIWDSIKDTRNTFRKVNKMEGVRDVAAGHLNSEYSGEIAFSFVISNSQLYCAGFDQKGVGNLGIGYKSIAWYQHNRVKFTPIDPNVSFNNGKIDSGLAFSIMLADGKLYACGDNSYGQFGRGNNSNQDTFVEVIITGNNTVKFDSNGGIGKMEEMIFSNGISQVLKQNTFTREGFKFMGWATSPTGTKTYDDQQSLKIYNINQTITLYALWGVVVPKVEISASTNEELIYGTGSITLTAKVNELTVDGVEYQYIWTKNGDEFYGTRKEIVISNVRDSGSYSVQVIVTYNGQKQDSYSESIDVVIKRADINASLNIDGWTFGDLPKAPTVFDNTDKGAVTYLYTGTTNGGSQYSAATAPDQAGNYVLTATIAQTANYNGMVLSKEFVVKKANITPKLTMESWTYGENAKIPVISGGGNGALSYRYTGKTFGGADYDKAEIPTQAGAYHLAVTVAQTPNYNGNVTNTVDFTIAKANIAPEIVLNGWVYGAASNTPELFGNLGNGALTYRYTGTVNNGDSYDSANIPRNAGSYNIQVNVAETANYNAGITENVKFTIARASYDTELAIKNWAFGSVANAPTYNNPENGAVTFIYTGKTNLNTVYDRNIAPDQAGSYNLKISIAQTDNYNASVKDVDFTLERADFKPNVAIENWNYGDGAKEPRVTGNIAGGAITYQYTGTSNAGISYSSANSPSQAGNYSIVVTIGQTANYNACTTDAANFTIARADINPIVTLESWVFGAKAKTPNIIGNTGNGAITHNYSGTTNANNQYSAAVAPTQAGSYNLKVIIAESANYNAGISNTVSFAIERANIDASVALSNWTYGNAANTPIIDGNTENGAVTYQYTGISNGSVSYNSDKAPSLAGNYNIKITIAKTANYNAGTAIAGFSITRANIAPTVSLDGWTFGEAAKIPVINGNIEDGSVSYHYTGKTNGNENYVSSGAPSKAGQYRLTVTIAQTANYNASETNAAEFTVAKANINPQVNIEGWVYGTAATTPNIIGNIENGSVSYLYTGTSNANEQYSNAKAPEQAGNYNLTVTIDATANYNGSTANADFIVARANLTPQVTLESWTYGKIREFPLITGNIEDGSVTYLYTGKSNANVIYSNTLAPEEAGTYNLLVSIGKTANYNATTVNVDFNIERADIEPLISIDGWTFGEVSKTPSIIGNKGNGAITYEYTGTSNEGIYYGSTIVPTQAGQYTLKAYIAATANYKAKDTNVAEFTIARANIDPGVSIEGWNYGEKAIAPKVMGNLGNGALTFLYTGTSNANDSYSSNKAPSAAGIYNIKITIAETANYKASFVNTSFVISRANISPRIALEGWTFGATANTPSITGNLGSGMLLYSYSGTTNANVKYESAAVPTQAGAYNVTVTIMETPNYNSNTATTAFTVARTGISPKVTLEDWTYGNIPNAPQISGNKGDGAVAYEYIGNTNSGMYYGSPFAPTQAGKYNLRINVSQTANYLAGYANVSFAVNKATVQAPTIDAKVFNNEKLTATVPNNIRYSVIKNDGGIAKGDYDVVLLLTDYYNYSWDSGVNVSGEESQYATIIFTISGSLNAWRYEPKIDNVIYGTALSYRYEALYGNNAVTVVYYNAAGEKLNGTPTSVGTYTAVFEVKATNDYTGLQADVAFRIDKADYDMSNVVFEDLTVKYNGEAQYIRVTGLPIGVSVEYDNNGKTEAGVYQVTAIFTGDYVNYNVLANMTATLIIKAAQLISDDNSVIVSSVSGFKPDARLIIKDAMSASANVDIKGMIIDQAYDISMKHGETMVQPDGAVTVRLLITDALRNRDNLMVYYVDADGNAVDMKAIRDGDYLIFSTDHFSMYVIAHEASNNAGAIAGGIVGGLIPISLGSAALILFLKRKRMA